MENQHFKEPEQGTKSSITVDSPWVIVDGRWIGQAPFFEGQPTITLINAMEIVSALVPVQIQGGVGFQRTCAVFPIAMAHGPKGLQVRWSTILYVEQSFDEAERKEIMLLVAQQLEQAERTRVQRSTGLIIGR